LSASEDGWEPAQVGEDALEWVAVPGTNVTLQLMKGWPLAILRAFAADFNAYVEPLRDGDSAAWTPTNSVATSNHLNGTAMDLNWDSHPFQVSYAGFDDAKIATCRELLAFYENTVQWGQDWGGDPYDCMHWQMGYGTFGNSATGDFITRKIRSDGFSMFRRDSVAPPAPVSKSDGYALATISAGQGCGITPRGIVIALAVELVETNLTVYANSNDPPSLDLPHDAVGSDHMSSGTFQQQPPWGTLADRMDPYRSAIIFFTVDNGPGVRGLTKIRDDNGDLYDYNDTTTSPGFFAQKVQGSEFPTRYDERMADAQALYDRLAATPPTPVPGDDMANVPQDEWTEALNLLRQGAEVRRQSLSPLREPGEDVIDTDLGFAQRCDGNVHPLLVYLLASLHEPSQIALLKRVAGMDPAAYPDRQENRELAQAILAKVTAPAAVPVAVAAVTASELAPQVVYVPQPPSTSLTAAASTGQVIGAAYDALEALNLSGVLTDTERAPLAALISVLQSKTTATA
jgi:hypothetical protein